MTKPQIQAMQTKLGLTPDGFWGPKSIAACQQHLRALMPKQNPWPKSDQKSLRAFYGEPGTGHTLLKLPYPLRLYAEQTHLIDEATVNTKCADSLYRVFEDILERHADDKRVMDHARDFFGVYDNRKKRGGTSLSVHAYAAAIDLAADTNGFKTSWPLKATMPLEIMECFAREGWLSAGAFWGYDAMHFQATR